MYGGNLQLNHSYAESRHRDFMTEAEAHRRLHEAGLDRRPPVLSAVAALRLTVGTALVRAGERIQGSKQATSETQPTATAVSSVTTLKVVR